jgi:hypothetical protein
MPTLAILVGILVNLSFLTSLSNTMNTRFGSMEARFALLEARLSALETKFDTKFDLLLGKVFELDNRLTRLEERLKH